MYDWCEAQGLDLDTLIHEEGTAQMEINFRHGEALHLADQILVRSEEHTSELQSLMRISYAVFCLKKKKNTKSEYRYNKDKHALHKIITTLTTTNHIKKR